MTRRTKRRPGPSLLARDTVFHPSQTHLALLRLSPQEILELHRSQDESTPQGVLLRVQIGTVVENVLRGRWTLERRGP